MNKWAQNLQQTLETGSDHNIVRGTQDIPSLPDVICQSFPEICFALRFSVCQHAFILAESTFHVAAPQIEAEAFFVYT